MDPEFATIEDNSGVWMSDQVNQNPCADKTPEVGILIFTVSNYRPYASDVIAVFLKRRPF